MTLLYFLEVFLGAEPKEPSSMHAFDEKKYGCETSCENPIDKVLAFVDLEFIAMSELQRQVDGV